MYCKIGVLFFCVMLLSTGILRAQKSGFYVYEDGTEIAVPDSINSQIRDGIHSRQELVLRWLYAEGFLNAKILSISDNRADIDKNCRFQLNKFEIQYNGGVDKVGTRSIDVKYSQMVLQNEIKREILEWNKKGYPFAKAQITRFTPDHANCSISINLEIDTGMKGQASGIYFSGHDLNSEAYLRKVSRFQPGEVITPGYLRFLRENLISSELFDLVGESQVFLRNGEPVIIFDVQERSLNQFDGLLGYVPDATGKGQIVGDLDLSLWNVLTEGNGLNFKYQRIRPETSELDVNVSQDWIGNIPIGLSAGFQFYQNDTTYQSRQFELGGTYRISGRFKLVGGIELQSSISGSNIPLIVEPDGSKRTARLGFEYTNLDRFDVPTSGNTLSLSYGIANKELQDDSIGVFVQNTLEINAHQYFSFSKRSVIALSIQGFILEASRVTLNDLIRFGGANSIRGYAEEQFRAGQILWGDIEYQFLLDRQSYLFVFGAYGAYHRPVLLTEPNNDFKITKELYSTGFGLSYQTQIGRLKFTYAISPEESFGNGKVHFGIRTGL